ncbi:MAG: hypothetical protein HRJ53_02995 [Acidobacteria bacterium Pan2503]|uniref:Uncharacterized protein n=1 Tax=Candidatus Acidiferrum panamense TaxID=2741543 RepID=A0A7V8SV94_9BACT|nr:hypothetical protein [Candidatus Acidoferrum panamensis]
MKGEQKDLLGGMARLAAIFERLGGARRDRQEIECGVCESWPCICGDPDFEAHNVEELRKAEERDQ